MYMEQPSLTSLDGPGVYLHQVILLKCITAESSVQSWRSNEYLNGDRGELALTLQHSPGDKEVGDGIEAILDAINGSTRTIYSTLRIVVSNDHPSFTVSCRNQDSGRNSNMTFYLIG